MSASTNPCCCSNPQDYLKYNPKNVLMTGAFIACAVGIIVILGTALAGAIWDIPFYAECIGVGLGGTTLLISLFAVGYLCSHKKQREPPLEEVEETLPSENPKLPLLQQEFKEAQEVSRAPYEKIVAFQDIFNRAMEQGFPDLAKDIFRFAVEELRGMSCCTDLYFLSFIENIDNAFLKTLDMACKLDDPSLIRRVLQAIEVVHQGRRDCKKHYKSELNEQYKVFPFDITQRPLQARNVPESCLQFLHETKNSRDLKITLDRLICMVEVAKILNILSNDLPLKILEVIQESEQVHTFFPNLFADIREVFVLPLSEKKISFLWTAEGCKEKEMLVEKLHQRLLAGVKKLESAEVEDEEERIKFMLSKLEPVDTGPTQVKIFSSAKSV